MTPFKIQNSKFKIHNILRVCTLFFLCCLTTMSAQGFSLDTRLLQGGSALKTQQGIKGLTQTNDLALKGDIFRTLYSQNDFPSQQSNRQGINAIAKKLTAGGTCMMDGNLTNDILFVLTTIPDIRQQLYHTLDIPLNNKLIIGDEKRRQSATLQDSCRNIIACLKGKEFENKETLDGQDRLGYCRRNVKKYFQLNQKLSQAYLTQTADIKDMNIYINNTLDDSPFDLMVDMQDIKKILFLTQSPEIPRMTFFSLPTVSIPNGGNGTANGSINAMGGGSLFPSGEISLDTSIKLGDEIIIPPSDTVTNSTIAAFIESNQNNTPSPVGSSSTNNQVQAGQIRNIIQAPLCIPSTSSDLSIDQTINDLGNNDELIDNQEIFSGVQAELMASLAPFLSYDDDRVGDFGNTLLTDLDNIILTSNPAPGVSCQASCDALPTTDGATDDIQKQTCEANCCITSCKTISNLRDKAVCLSQCLCTDIAFPGVNAKPELKKIFENDMLRIRFCRVPAMNTIIQPNKKITTIEEALDGINAILGKLKAGGKLTPRNKSKEFLDSTFSDIKFKDILAFDIFVAVKPIYDKISFANVAAQKKKDAVADRDVFIIGGHDLSDSREKNKYIIIGSHAPALAAKQPISTYQDYQQLLDQQTEKIKKYQQSTKATAILDDQKQGHDEILDELAQFYSANMLFRQQIIDKTDSFHQTSQTFADKAIKAK